MKTTLNYLLGLAFIMCLIALACNAANAQTSTVTTKTIVAKPTIELTFDSNVAVEVKESKSSRIIVETYVSTNGGQNMTSSVATIVAPQVVSETEESVSLKQLKTVTVNGHDIKVKHVIFVPNGTEVKYN